MRTNEVEIAPVFPVLDSLRLVGAAFVVVTHTSFWAGAYTSTGVIGPVLARLDVGVAIFFVLSGFLLSRSWFARAHLGLPAPGVGRYLWKRLLRIYPVYAITVVIALATLSDNRSLGISDWLITLSMLNIYLDPTLPAGLTQMWSLATELSFYLTLPVLMLVLLGRRPRLVPSRVWAGLAAMAVASPVWLAWVVPTVGLPGEGIPNEWLPAFTLWFGLGMALAYLHVQMQAGQLPESVQRLLLGVARMPGTLWVVCLGLLLLASTSLGGPTLLYAATGAEAATKNLLYAGIGFLIVLTGVFVAPGSTYDRVMSHPWLRHLGHTSYSVFCIHMPMLHLVSWVTGYELFRGHLIPLTLITLAASIIAAEALYRVVELPAMRLRDLGRSRGSAASQKPTESVNTTK